MPLLRTHRRRLGPVIAAVLMLVMVGALMPDPMAEGHPPGIAAPLQDWRAYFSENFGDARSFPFLRGLMFYVFGTSSDPRVFIGERGHLYLNAEEVVGQSTGTTYRKQEVERFVNAADAMRQWLNANGGNLVVLMPPNPASVATQDLPAWWHISGPLEYDLAMRELQQRGIKTIDLKAVFTAIPDINQQYRLTDSHWRWNAALLAFNLAMNHIGHAEWALDAAIAFRPLSAVPAGDLARLIGLQNYLSDEDYPLRLASAEPDWHPIDVLRSPPYAGVFPAYAFERANSGERLLVLGDSSTAGLWREFLLHTGASRIGWMHHARCAVDFRDIERFRPTWVILAPTERTFPCPVRNWPRGLTARAP